MTSWRVDFQNWWGRFSLNQTAFNWRHNHFIYCQFQTYKWKICSSTLPRILLLCCPTNQDHFRAKGNFAIRNFGGTFLKFSPRKHLTSVPKSELSPTYLEKKRQDTNAANQLDYYQTNHLLNRKRRSSNQLEDVIQTEAAAGSWTAH